MMEINGTHWYIDTDGYYIRIDKGDVIARLSPSQFQIAYEDHMRIQFEDSMETEDGE